MRRMGLAQFHAEGARGRCWDSSQLIQTVAEPSLLRSTLSSCTFSKGFMKFIDDCTMMIFEKPEIGGSRGVVSIVLYVSQKRTRRNAPREETVSLLREGSPGCYGMPLPA